MADREARRGIATMLAHGWRGIRSAGPRRLAVTGGLLLAALLLARFSWSLPITDDAERALYDLRTVALAERTAQDDRVLMVVYDDQTLIKARKRSPLDRGLLSAALRNLDAMGAKAIGIDILFDQPQDEDEELIATLRAMRTPVLVAYAETETTELDIEYEQQQFLDRFVARLEGSKARPASILLDNNFGVTRSWPHEDARSPPLMSRAMLVAGGDGRLAMPGYEGALRYRQPAFADRPVFTRLQIDLFADPELAPAFAEQVAGRYVLIGGDIVDFDRVQTPFTNFSGKTVETGASDYLPPGVEIHATMLAQLLDGARMPKPFAWVLWGQALLVVIMATLSALIELRSWKFAPLFLAQAALILGLPFFLHARGVDTHGFPAVGPALGWVIAFVAVVSAARASGAVQRRFAQGALGKYLPRSIAQQIIDRPELLALHGEKKEIFVLFSDLEGFTKMSHAIEPEVVASLLNRYLDLLSQVVLDHGGVIDKFVGDAVVAFWGAPIALPHDGMRASQAGYALWEAGERFRAEVDPALPPIGRTRVGLHFGEAVVGNFGGKDRIQYTALGDSMNTASRLEAANKALETKILASREIVERSELDWWRPMGRVTLRGRRRPVDVFEPAPDFPKHDRVALEEAMRLIDENRADGIALIERIAARNADDKALKNLLNRSRELNEEGTYVLG
jgi:adenylate cyclase